MDFNAGDHVGWNSEARRISRTTSMSTATPITRARTLSKTRHMSSKTDHIAVHWASMASYVEWSVGSHEQIDTLPAAV